MRLRTIRLILILFQIWLRVFHAIILRWLENIKDAERDFRLGIEKIVINLYRKFTICSTTRKEFGSQAIVASVDYKILNNEKKVIFPFW